MDSLSKCPAGRRVIAFSSIASRRWSENCSARDLVNSPSRRLTYEHMPPGESESVHLHDRAHQLFHVVSGVLWIEVADGALRAMPGDTLEVPPGAFHRAFTDSSESATFLVFSTPTTEGDRREAPLITASTSITRRAVESDVPELVRLRKLMFEDMGLDASDTGWEAAAGRVIAGELASGRMVAVVADSPTSDGVLAASGIVQFEVGLPVPGIESPGRAHISSMSTDREHRRRGLAGAILDDLLEECADRGVEVIGLHATPQGRSIYERRGFRTRDDNPEMRLVRRRER